ncbi:Hypothetical Protein FCC1311_035252 [Hondaea fermentalgiana]|uniref:Uncharacterized protein n=1 Tax=Hondaea fermentalgiana TaxID=2315210 RepID=A0A2R5GFA5_9STRA|nr:Hypothetical Protein FCC1311_035252 [Hondaea fermentalgiana]|eukprot:GBG27303.1 Hypothetical Protein FCC1311_035252 [Hondaea fermentalgiana]
MPAPSMLARGMPDLELPPPSPGASAFGTRNMAQSAPSAGFLSSKQVLHALRIRPRSGSNEMIPMRSSEFGAVEGGSSSATRRRDPRVRARVSFDGDIGAPILLEGDEDEEDDDEAGDDYGHGRGHGGHGAFTASDLIDADDDDDGGPGAGRSVRFEPSSMEVFSAIRSLTEDTSFAQRVAASAPADRALAVAAAIGRSGAGGDPQAAAAAAAQALGLDQNDLGATQPAPDTAGVVHNLRALRLGPGSSASHASSSPRVGGDGGANAMSGGESDPGSRAGENLEAARESMGMGVAGGMQMDMDLEMDSDMDMEGGTDVFEQFEMDGLSSADKHLGANTDSNDRGHEAHNSGSPKSPSSAHGNDQ